MTARRSALDDPDCPECECSVFTKPAKHRPGGTWWCFACTAGFTPPPAAD